MPTETVCPKCEGTGWIIRERAHLSGAERCDCRSTDPPIRLRGERAQFPPNYENTSFDNFSVRPDNPVARGPLTTILMTVKAYVRNFPDPKVPGLLLVGDPGTGKTHLAVAALKAIMENSKLQGLFCNYQTLLNSIKAGYDATSNSSDREAYRTALEADVLLLDDLGAHRVTDWVEDTVTAVVTHRCDHRKPLIATTNLPDPDADSIIYQKNAFGRPELRRTLAEHIGIRARSRLFEMCTVIQMPNMDDYRILQKKRKT